MTLSPSNRLRRACAALAAGGALALAHAASAPAAAPDLPFATPVVRAAPQAQAAVSGANLKRGLARHMRRSGGKAGAWVGDPVTGRTLFSSGGSKRFQIASNMKVFTTATALATLGPTEQFETRLVANGPFADGIVQGDLVLEGGGDPSLTSQGLGRLADQARSKDLDRVTGRLLFDESVFDAVRTVPRKGISGGPFDELGRLSGLSYESGRSSDPARSAAAAMANLLRERGVSLSKEVGPGSAPATPAPEAVIGEVTSSSLAALSRSTNTFSINFYAEMLLKDIAAAQSGVGTTAGGAALVRGFASQAGATLKTQNGSGLSRSDVASPRSVGALLAHMLSEEEQVRDAFLGSLAVAGGTGTLARRMRGTSAQGNCIGKTGTLRGVSALSGYCEVGPDRFVVFSILMKKVDIGRAHVAQDRMAALIARYNP